MPIKNDAASYGWVAIVLHWLMAVLMLAMFAGGLWMTTLGYYDSWYHRAPELHKSVGMVLFLLLFVRLVWRLTNPRPELMGQAWERLVALTVHRLHYGIMLVLVISGYLIPTAEGQAIHVFDVLTVPALFSIDHHTAQSIGRVHQIAAWVMVVLAALHAGAALKHHFIDRDRTLLRMLGLGR